VERVREALYVAIGQVIRTYNSPQFESS
jgi:hypothetical protein